jgi:hypothetical protein
MSHAGSWRAACGITIYFLAFHLEAHSVARGVTDPGVGSGALLDAFSGFVITVQITTIKRSRQLGFHSFGHGIKLKDLWHNRFQLPAAGHPFSKPEHFLRSIQKISSRFGTKPPVERPAWQRYSRCGTLRLCPACADSHVASEFSGYFRFRRGLAEIIRVTLF